MWKQNDENLILHHERSHLYDVHQLGAVFNLKAFLHFSENRKVNIFRPQSAESVLK